MTQNKDEKLKAFLAQYGGTPTEAPVGEWNRIRARMEEERSRKKTAFWFPVLATAASLAVAVFVFQNRVPASDVDSGLDAYLTETYGYLEDADPVVEDENLGLLDEA